MRVLGIDPGSSAGYAYGLPGQQPKSGTIRLDSGMSNGRRFATLEGRVRNLIGVYEIDMVVMEAPYIQTDPSKFDIQVVRLGYGYQAAILMACEKEGIGAERITLVESTVWRKYALGRGNAPKDVRPFKDGREWLKQEAIKSCDKRGWPIRSQDEAEACLIWEWGTEQLEPGVTVGRLPLFEMTTL